MAKNKNYLRTLAILFLSMTLASPVFAVSDSEITSTVKNKIAADPSLSGTSITVKTNEGNVKLEGVVNSETQANSITELTQSTDGVNDVNTSNLTVKSSNQPLTDGFITAKIKGKFIQSKLFSDKDIAAMSISVETNNGVVTLGGTATDQTQIDNAIKIAKSIPGVKEVKSSVKLT